MQHDFQSKLLYDTIWLIYLGWLLLSFLSYLTSPCFVFPWSHPSKTRHLPLQRQIFWGSSQSDVGRRRHAADDGKDWRENKPGSAWANTGTWVSNWLWECFCKKKNLSVVESGRTHTHIHTYMHNVPVIQLSMNIDWTSPETAKLPINMQLRNLWGTRS